MRAESTAIQSLLYLEGTVAWDFLSLVISPEPEATTWTPASWSKAISSILWIQIIWPLRGIWLGKKQKYEFPMYLAAAANLVLRCWLQRRIWFCAMGTTPNLVLHYGPRRQIWHPAVGHNAVFWFSAGFGSLCTLGDAPKNWLCAWATEKNLLMCYGSLCRSWLCAMGHTQDLVCASGHSGEARLKNTP